METKFLFCHVTLLLQNVAVGFIHIWCKDTEENASHADYSHMIVRSPGLYNATL